MCAGEGGGAFHFDVPPHPALMIVLLVLVPLFLLVVFHALLEILASVPVPLPLTDVTEVFIVGMEVLISTR